MLRRIFGLKGDEVTGSRKIDKEKFYNLYQ
jgi:hypothetical protein